MNTTKWGRPFWYERCGWEGKWGRGWFPRRQPERELSLLAGWLALPAIQTLHHHLIHPCLYSDLHSHFFETQPTSPNLNLLNVQARNSQGRVVYGWLRTAPPPAFHFRNTCPRRLLPLSLLPPVAVRFKVRRTRMADGADNWVFDSLVNFLRGPIWNVPILTLIENKSLGGEHTTS